jgi:hypothetical protein
VKRRPVFVVGALVVAAACSGGDRSTQQRTQIIPGAVRSHLAFLADDLLEGRVDGTRGFELAAKYAASQFAAYGLQPAGSGGTYYQRVHFRRITPIPAKSSLTVEQGGWNTLKWGVDFVARGSPANSAFTVTAPIVFVGYGIVDRDYGHNDYTQDVRGAIAAFLPGVPPHLPRARREYYDSIKWDLARQQGAVATIELSTPETDKAWPWDERIHWVSDGASTWLEPNGDASSDTLLPRILLSTAGTERLLALTSRTMANVVAASGSFRVSTARLTLVANEEEFNAPHVIAVLPGRDQNLSREYVAYVAHLDGAGGEAVDGDGIYNSAIDNGLGSAILLALAEAYGRRSDQPNRSVLFIATAGEELGIVGSPYFVEHPTVPLDSIVAVINIDGPSTLVDAFPGVLAMGASNSSLSGAVGRAAEQLGLRVHPVSAPLNFSDHWPFVLKGIPSLWIVADGGSPSKAGEEIQRRIHTPFDDMNRTFRWEDADTLARLNYSIGLDVANEPNRPRWNEGDILGNRFGKRDGNNP